MTRHTSIEPVLPGEYIADELESRGWTQDDLAVVLGRSRTHVNRLIQGKTAITPESAQELAKAFETSPELWMNLQVAFELSKVTSVDRDIERRRKLFDKVPMRDVVRRGWIKDSKQLSDQEDAVCKFLQIKSIDDEIGLSVAARKSTSYESCSPGQLAWFARVKKLAECVSVSKYSESNFSTLIESLQKLTAYPEDLRRVPSTLAEFGVRLVLVEHLPKTKIDGAAMWLDDSPAVAVSLRYDRIDNFWHTLMHELVHILRRDAEIVDEDMFGRETELSETESLVNSLAANYLIPTEKIESFILRQKPLFYESNIVKFAQARGVHPGIVVGQLHFREALPWSRMTKFLVKVRTYIVGQALTDGWGNTPSIF